MKYAISPAEHMADIKENNFTFLWSLGLVSNILHSQTTRDTIINIYKDILNATLT
jgi:hypothetical protein